MLFISGLWRVLRGFWRLLIGLVIGAILYVWMFFEYKDFWENVHHQTTRFMDWLVAQPMLTDYSQWNTLLNLDDKLTFALFIMGGRIVWMIVESIFISFPYWLIIGRRKNQKSSTLEVKASPVAKADFIAADKPPLPRQGIPPASAEQAAEAISNTVKNKFGEKKTTN
jgi:hypothetical protein